MSELPADHVICPNCVHHFHAVSQESKDYIAALKATIQTGEAVMRLLADDLRKVLSNE